MESKIFILVIMLPLSIFGQNALDYSNDALWAALPAKFDSADYTPDNYEDLQSTADVDVFFLHPTSYLKKKFDGNWNAPIDNEALNETTCNGSIKNQASVFNGSAKIYAPFYRQAHIESYYIARKRPEEAKGYFEIAYADVKAAFEYYLENWNQGRPIIIASHSQGTTHAGQLLLEFFDEKELKEQLVAAYIIGMPVAKNHFKEITPCEEDNDIQCFCSWRTVNEKYRIKKNDIEGSQISVINPLNWTLSSNKQTRDRHKGILLPTDGSISEPLVDAQVKNGYLWVNKPKFKGSIFIQRKNYHIGDYNIFWVNIRENIAQRVDQYMTTQARK